MQRFEGTFRGPGEVDLWWSGWIPDRTARAVVVVAHGIAEHWGRYHRLAAYFSGRGLAVYGFDYRGHGKSAGRRCQVDTFSRYSTDFALFIDMVRARHPGQKVFIFGHSLGALVALNQAGAGRQIVSGVIVSGVPLHPRPSVPSAVVSLLRPLAFIAPGLGLYRLNSASLSHDRAVVKAYDDDPLVYRGKLPARTVIGLIRSARGLAQTVRTITVPVLILHGEEDRLCDPRGSRTVYARAGSKDKTLKFFPGCYHEILNEPQGEQVLTDMMEWLDRRI